MKNTIALNGIILAPQTAIIKHTKNTTGLNSSLQYSTKLFSNHIPEITITARGRRKHMSATIPPNIINKILLKDNWEKRPSHKAETSVDETL